MVLTRVAVLAVLVMAGCEETGGGGGDGWHWHDCDCESEYGGFLTEEVCAPNVNRAVNRAINDCLAEAYYCDCQCDRLAQRC